MWVLFHVDDALVVGKNDNILREIDAIGNEFTIKKLGVAHFFLGIEIFRRWSGYALSQQAFCAKLIERFGMDGCNSRVTPFPANTSLVKDGELLDVPKHDEYRSLVGGLLYLSVNTRFDVSFHVGKFARYMSAPTKEHLGTAYHLLR